MKSRVANELQEDREVEPLLEEPTKKNVEQEEQVQHIVLAQDQAQENVLTQDLILEKARLCQKRCRSIARVKKELAKSPTFEYEANLTNFELSINSICTKSNAIVHFITKELDSCLTLFACQVILE
jgi:hypothetical protein